MVSYCPATVTFVVESSASFTECRTDTSRLVCSPTLPAIESLRSGDLVICPDVWGSQEFASAARARGAHIRTGQYRWEDTTVTRQRSRPMLINRLTSLMAAPRGAAIEDRSFVPDAVTAQTDAFHLAWDALSTPPDRNPVYTPATEFVPQHWVQYLPFASLNPAQAEAAPALLGTSPVVVVAPTGAGKTLLGMLAALEAIKGQGKKAAWLVPQRSLTAELDQELDSWRGKDIKVVALSGETRSDLEATKNADLWVATTEKFEALCRSSSMRETIAQIGTLIVDEVHLLGEPNRGPVLETLLARIRSTPGQVRLVGLSATASNADDVASWLGADLVSINWRPTRLTTQIVTVAAGADNREESRYRSEAAAAITAKVTRDGGSVLVFCGTKANVRATALAVAAERGEPTDDIDPYDTGAVYAACSKAGVGLHYSDWPHKKASELQFKDRDIDVLVATSTLAAGVNTPARAVVVRDVTIGPQSMEVSMVQQMFGRAGRAGKEPEGWSFLITTPAEAIIWRQRLADGYTIMSGIDGSVEEHLLGEITQRNVRTLRQAESWWESTLAFHQGNRDRTPLNRARDFLSKWRFITAEESADGDMDLASTRLGQVTSRMMIPVRDAASMIAALSEADEPRNAGEAEATTMGAVATHARHLAEGHDAPVDEGHAVTAILRKYNVKAAKPGRGVRVKSPAVSLAGMLIATRDARALNGSGRTVHGVTRSLFNAALYDSPRYFAWVSAVGALGVVPGWAAVVSLDVGRRIAWWRFATPRGTGRLLWACEHAARGNVEVAQLLYREARENGCTCPEEWASTGGSRMLPHSQTINKSRVSLGLGHKGVAIPAGSAAYLRGADGRWEVARDQVIPVGRLGAVFSPRGDAVGTEWLEHFQRPR